MNLQPTLSPLDHVLVHVSDIDAGIAAFRDLSGVEAAIGGRHPAHGTVNALASMGDSYLELIATRQSDGAAAALDLMHFAVRADDIDAAAAAVAQAGLGVDWMDGERQKPDGTTLSWRAFDIVGQDHAGTLPFFIHWGDTPNPAQTEPGGLSDPRLTALSPDAAALRALYRAIGIDIAVEDSTKPGLRMDVGTPRGPITLSGSACGWRKALLSPAGN